MTNRFIIDILDLQSPELRFRNSLLIAYPCTFAGSERQTLSPRPSKQKLETSPKLCLRAHHLDNTEKRKMYASLKLKRFLLNRSLFAGLKHLLFPVPLMGRHWRAGASPQYAPRFPDMIRADVVRRGKSYAFILPRQFRLSDLANKRTHELLTLLMNVYSKKRSER
jgi:hypothetical protein